MGNRDVRNRTTLGQDLARDVADGDARVAVKGGELSGRVARDALSDVPALRRLLQRVEQRKLGPEDWALLRAVLREAEKELEAANRPLRF